MGGMVKYYVLFMDSDSPRWWMRHLKPGFKHCGVLQQIGDRAYVYVENLYNKLHADVSFIDIEEVRAMVEGIIVEYDAPEDEITFNHFEPMTCVTVIKKLIGIPDIWIQTPYQLYKYLLKNGGTVWED